MKDASSVVADSYAPVPESAVPGIVWPAIPSVRNADALALLAQFGMTQWWSPEALLGHQLHQATALVDYAAKNAPFYRKRLASHKNRTAALTLEDWQEIPILTRADIQEAGEALSSRHDLKAHGDYRIEQTSGSTGEPVTVRWNAVTSRLHTAFTMRDHLWHRRKLGGKLAVVRRLPEKVIKSTEAGQVGRWALGHASGPMAFFEVTDSVSDAFDWLMMEDPDYLTTYPTYLNALLRETERTGIRPSRMDQVMTFGEVVPDDLRQRCRDVWDAKLVDMYSAQEVGVMALECPDQDLYHVQSEGILLEVLDETGQSCAPGEVGRVVVTPLHNFATPMIRYFIGDYAEVGEACPCGRGLPVIRRFYGRSRNMLTLPSGGKIWVAVNDCGLNEVAAVRQFQIVQKPDLSVQLKLVVDRPLTPEETAIAQRAMVAATGHEFDLELAFVDLIPRLPGGKLEDVVSEVVD